VERRLESIFKREPTFIIAIREIDIIRTAKDWAIDQEKWHSLKNERTYSKHFE
jgi:hypothetical protein